MTRAADEAHARGQLAMVGFNYRRVPATALARRMLAEGRVGRLRHVRVTYLQDWLVDPKAPLTWRLRKELAGSGALGDLGAHIVDLAQYPTGSGSRASPPSPRPLVRERPPPEGAAGDCRRVGGRRHRRGHGRRRRRLHRPPHLRRLVSFEATRYATGRKNALRIELNGERGSLAFDLERLNELSYHDGTEPGSTPDSAASSSPNPSIPTWTPGGRRARGSATSTFVHQARDLVHAVAEGRRPEPSFADGLQVQRVLAGGGGERREEFRLHPDRPLRRLAATCRATSLSSPASGRTCLWRRSAASPATSATRAGNSPAGATTSRSTRPSRTPPTWTPATSCSTSTG